MTSRPRQAARRAVRALAPAETHAPGDLAASLQALRRRHRRVATRIQQRLDHLAEEARARYDELSSRVAALELTARSRPLDDQADLVRRIWLHEGWLRAMPPEGVLVSVVVPTRHRPDLLRRALRSLLAQTYGEWEALVVDDGDRDRAAEVRAVVDELADARIRVVPAHNGNEPSARNTGLDAASGEIVTYLDDDNVMFPVWLAALVDGTRRHPEAPLLYGARVTRDDGGAEQVHLADFDRRSLEEHNSIDTGQIGHRADPRLRWDPELLRFSDWDLVLRLTDDRPGVQVLARAVGYTTEAPDRISDAHEFDASADRVRAGVRRRRPAPLSG